MLFSMNQRPDTVTRPDGEEMVALPSGWRLTVFTVPSVDSTRKVEPRSSDPSGPVWADALPGAAKAARRAPAKAAATNFFFITRFLPSWLRCKARLPEPAAPPSANCDPVTGWSAPRRHRRLG